MKLKNEYNIPKPKISSPGLNKNNNNVLFSHKKYKLNNNIYTINNKVNLGTDNKNKNSKLSKSIFSKIKNNVLISNTYNFKHTNENENKKNLKKFFFNKKINISKNLEKTQFNDIYYYKNNDFVNKNKFIYNITKSQRIFKFYMPKENSKRDINLNFYRYSGTNICKNNINYNNNFNNF